MNDGGKESGRNSLMSSKKIQQQKYPSSSSDFGSAVIRIALSQICESTGFHSVQRSVLDALAHVTQRYMLDIGKNAIFYANLAGRNSCNVFDIIQALEDLSSSQGFSGASDVHHCLVNSGVVREIIKFVNSGEEIPFAQFIPSFPVTRALKHVPSFALVGEAPAGKHIPNWLPKFLDPHTYTQATVWTERAIDPQADKVERMKQQRKAESSLLSLQQRLSYGSSAWSGTLADGAAGKGKQVVGTNAFLAPPFSYGEKEVSQVLPLHEAPAGKNLSILETFAPVIESARVESLEVNNSEKKIILGNRPKLHFKIGIDKKSISASLWCDALNDKKICGH